MEFGWDLGATMGALCLLGVGYNLFVGWLEREGYAEGYMSLLVVAGTVMTLVGATFVVGVEAALKVAACFVASGVPMIVGSCIRHGRERRATVEEVRKILKGGSGDANGEKAWRLCRSAGVEPGDPGE